MISTSSGNIERSKDVSLEILILSNDVLSANTKAPIEVTLLPISTLVNLFRENALSPIEVTLSGITTLVNSLF